MIPPLRRALGPLVEHERLLMISIATVLVMAGQGVIAPILPLYAQAFGVGAAVVGLTLTFFALARLMLNVPLGVVSDRYGRRLLVVSGPLVTAIGMFGSGFAVSIYDLLAWRFVAGAGSAMYMTGAQIYLADISSPENRARFIGTNQSALLLGTAIGPAIGGITAELWGLAAPFHVVGAGALIAGVYAWWRIPETRHLALAQLEADRAAERERNGGEVAPTERFAWLRFIRTRDFSAVAAVTMSIFFTRTAARQTLMPLIASARLGMSAGGLGALFTAMSVVNMVLIAPASWIADRFGRKWSIVPSGIVVAGSLLVIAWAWDAPIFIAGAMVLAVGTAMAGPAPAAYAADIAPPHLRGLAMGLYRSSGDVGFVIGPPLLGALADWTSFGWALSFNAALMAATAIFFLLAARETIAARRATREAAE